MFSQQWEPLPCFHLLKEENAPFLLELLLKVQRREENFERPVINAGPPRLEASRGATTAIAQCKQEEDSRISWNEYKRKARCMKGSNKLGPLNVD
jgi:hypothetical protein